MTARGHYNGHPTEYIGGTWRYADTHEPADDPRPCPHCGRLPTPEGHDACLGTLPNVSHACCGHGARPAYIVYEDGHREDYPPDEWGHPLTEISPQRAEPPPRKKQEISWSNPHGLPKERDVSWASPRDPRLTEAPEGQELEYKEWCVKYIKSGGKCPEFEYDTRDRAGTEILWIMAISAAIVVAWAVCQIVGRIL